MQKQTLKCADARHYIHLADDVSPEEEQQLAEHLHSCAECRAYHAGMADALYALERVRNEAVMDTPSTSLWPAMADRLNARVSRQVTAEPEPRRFNVAVVALCACSLMLALVTAIQNLPNNNDPYGGYTQLPAVGAPTVNVNWRPGVKRPQQTQPRLIPVTRQDGTIVPVDPVTNQAYVPEQTSVMPVRSTDPNLEF